MSAPGPLVLVIEDEASVRQFLRSSLRANGFRTLFGETAELGLRVAKEHNPDLVLLDLGLPDRDGLDVLLELRTWFKQPVLVLSARGREDDKVSALDGGADDYVTKPFGTGELLARIRVALRHAQGRTSEAARSLRVGDLELDLAARRVRARGQDVHLTATEYKLFALLMSHAGKALTHRQLLTEVWGPGHQDQLQYLRAYMLQLRHKLEENPARPRYLMTEPGVGYRLRVAPSGEIKER